MLFQGIRTSIAKKSYIVVIVQCGGGGRLSPPLDTPMIHEMQIIRHCCLQLNKETYTVLPAKSDSDAMFCLQSYQGLVSDKSLVY